MTGMVQVTPSFRPGTPSSLADGAFEVFRRAPFSLLAISAAANLPIFAAASAMAILVRDQPSIKIDVLILGTGTLLLGVAMAYRAGRSIRQNAARHVRNNYLLKIDFRDFFPSIRKSDVLRVLTEHAVVLREALPAAEDREHSLATL